MLFRSYSHQQALSQCEGYLTAQPKFTPHAYSNTAAAAKYIAQEGEPHQAAIASRKCAAMYGPVSYTHLSSPGGTIGAELEKQEAGEKIGAGTGSIT